MSDDDIDVFALLVDLRGGLPDKCDFCQQPMAPEDAIPEEAGDWACRTCYERWEAEDAAKKPQPEKRGKG